MTNRQKSFLSRILLAVVGAWLAVACRDDGGASLILGTLSNPAIVNVRAEETRSSTAIHEWRGTADRLELAIVRRSETAKAAERAWTALRVTMESYAGVGPVPYPGYVSNRSACPDELKPKILPEISSGGAMRRGAIAPANARKAFGFCDPADVEYFALVALIRCEKSGESFEIKLWARKADPVDLDAVFRQFACI